MKSLHLLILCGLLTLAIQGNGQKIKKNATYFKSPSKVGILVVAHATYLLTSGGVLTTTQTTYQLTSGGGPAGAGISPAKSTNKYVEALYILEPQINPSEKIIEVYKDLYTQKGKSVVVIQENLDSLNLQEFVPPKTGKKYYKKDLRFLKEKFQIDEILIVSVAYGVSVSEAFGVEVNQLGMCSVQTEIINLNDNSFVMRELTGAIEKIQGDWNTPPAYDKLKTSIQTAIEEFIAKEKEKYK